MGKVKSPSNTSTSSRLASMLLLVSIGNGGCQQTRFSQVQYVGIVNDKTGDSQFYRLEIKGRPGLNKTHFASGWYTRDSIETLSGNRLALLFDNVKLDSKGPDTADPVSYLVTGPEGEAKFLKEDKQYAIVMASNPSPILGALSDLSNDKELLSLIKSRMEKQRQEENDRAAGVKSLMLGVLDKAVNNEEQRAFLMGLLNVLYPDAETPRKPAADQNSKTKEGN